MAITTDPKLKDKIATAGKYGANVRAAAGMDQRLLWSAKAGTTATLTGRVNAITWKGKPEKWYEVGTQVGIRQADGSIKKELRTGWTHSDNVVKIEDAASTATDAAAQEKLLELVTKDKELYKKGIAILKLLVEKEKQGIDVTPYKKQFAELYTRWRYRQDELQRRLKDALKVETPEGVKAMGKYLGVPGLSGLGILPIIIGAVVVGVILGALVMYGLANMFGWLAKEYSNSTKDLEISAELEKALSTLTPEERAKVEENLELQVDTAHGQGKQDGENESTWGMVKTLALVTIGGVLAYKFIGVSPKPRAA